MSNTDKVMEFLQSIHPHDATNSDIVAATRIESHQQVFQITRKLCHGGLISGFQNGKEWSFSAKSDSTESSKHIHGMQPPPLLNLDSSRFESFARERFSSYFGTSLHARRVIEVHKIWDMVSDDGQIIGDAKYFTLVHGTGLPPAKFSVIAEHVWLLEKTGAAIRFLAFGNQIDVPDLWLKKFGNLVTDVQVYFLEDSGKITRLK